MRFIVLKQEKLTNLKIYLQIPKPFKWKFQSMDMIKEKARGLCRLF